MHQPQLHLGCLENLNFCCFFKVYSIKKQFYSDLFKALAWIHMGKSLHIVDIYCWVSVQQGEETCVHLRSEEKWRNFLIVSAFKLYSFRPMWKSFPKILQPVYFLPFYFLHGIHWQRWEDKYSFFLLDCLWPPLSLSRRAKEIAEETRYLLTQPTQQGHKDASNAMLQKVLLSVQQADFSSESYKLG